MGNLIRIKIFFLIFIFLGSCNNSKVNPVKINFNLSNITRGLQTCNLDSLKNITTQNGYMILKKEFFDTYDKNEIKKSFKFLDTFISKNEIRLVSDTNIVIVEKGDEAFNSISSMELLLKGDQWLINNFVMGK